MHFWTNWTILHTLKKVWKFTYARPNNFLFIYFVSFPKWKFSTKRYFLLFMPSLSHLVISLKSEEESAGILTLIELCVISKRS